MTELIKFHSATPSFDDLGLQGRLVAFGSHDFGDAVLECEGAIHSLAFHYGFDDHNVRALGASVDILGIDGSVVEYQVEIELLDDSGNGPLHTQNMVGISLFARCQQ